MVTKIDVDTRIKIQNLVSKFKRNEKDLVNPNYLEARVRADYIDPFFEALGWDIRNEEGTIEANRQVILEANICINGKKLRPDYEFR